MDETDGSMGRYDGEERDADPALWDAFARFMAGLVQPSSVSDQPPDDPTRIDGVPVLVPPTAVMMTLHLPVANRPYSVAIMSTLCPN